MKETFTILQLCHCCCSVAQLCPTLWPHGLQHAKLPCPSLFPGVCSNLCPLSWWCHNTIMQLCHNPGFFFFVIQTMLFSTKPGLTELFWKLALLFLVWTQSHRTLSVEETDWSHLLHHFQVRIPSPEEQDGVNLIPVGSELTWGKHGSWSSETAGRLHG